ncbi:Fur family transcriptional regulator [Planctomicrobium sp. SH668]|uniref:Fur family transcriptional regulator n=1 Tax=Planctomicrobium sp. SH668 TaxID=3448126 RepID=UPI003F5C835F
MSAYQIRPEQVERAREILRSAGLRSTPARISVLLELQTAVSPLTHADLAERLVPTGFDKTTIFRNLNDLADAELVRRTELGDHVWRFELKKADGHDENHPHFICVDCGEVTCLSDVELTSSSRKRSNEVGRVTEILLKGHCAGCDQKAV